MEISQKAFDEFQRTLDGQAKALRKSRAYGKQLREGINSLVEDLPLLCNEPAAQKIWNRLETILAQARNEEISTE